MVCSGAARFTMTDEGVAPGLWLIGIGPGDLDHITERARRVATECSKRYLEGYTAVLPPAEEGRLESVVGPWKRLMRDSVESPENLLEEARESAIALLVVGDPMQATTHIDLEERCAGEGIGFHVIPGLTSTALAVSVSGLQSYRFGRQVTIPFSDGEYLPTSPFEMICRNKEAGMHTLALLDLDPTGMGLEQPRPMTPGEAVDHLIRMSERSEEFDESVADWKGLLLSDLGTEEERVISGSMHVLSQIEGGYIHALIIAAKFSGMEAEAFERRRISVDTTG